MEVRRDFVWVSVKHMDGDEADVKLGVGADSWADAAVGSEIADDTSSMIASDSLAHISSPERSISTSLLKKSRTSSSSKDVPSELSTRCARFKVGIPSFSFPANKNAT